MAQARYKELLCIVVDVGPAAAQVAPMWPLVLERIMANRMTQERPHLELAIIAYGSDTTDNLLWTAANPNEYKGVRVVSGFAPCNKTTFTSLPTALAAGSTASDHYCALVTACDLLQRAVTDRKLQAARKSIVFASPFALATPAVDADIMAQLAASLEAMNPPTVSAGVVCFPASAPYATSPPEARAANLQLFDHLHRRNIEGSVLNLPDAWALAALARSHSSGQMIAQTLKIGEFELAVKAGKLTSYDTNPTLKPYCGDAAAPTPEAFATKETTSYLKGGDPANEADQVQKEDREKMYRFGSDYFPAEMPDAYKWQPKSTEAGFKGLQVLAFVQDTWTAWPPAAEGEEEPPEWDPFPRWAALDGPWSVVPATHKAAHALSALARAAHARRRLAVVRYALIASAAISLGVLVPVLGERASDFDHFLLFKVPWANEYKSLVLPDYETFAEQLAVTDEQAAVGEEYVTAMSHPLATYLPSDLTMDPVRSCHTLAMVQAGVRGPAAATGGLDGDELVKKVMLPGAVPKATTAALRTHFPTASTADVDDADAAGSAALAAEAAAAIAASGVSGGAAAKAEPDGVKAEAEVIVL